MGVFFDRNRGRWRYDFVLGGVRHAKECVGADGQPVASKRAAVQVEADARRVARMTPKLPRANDLTVAQAMDGVSDAWLKTADWPNKQRIARELIAYFKPETPVRDIDGAQIQDYIAHLLRQPIMIWIGGQKKRSAPDADKFWVPHADGRTRAHGTVNRHLPILRAMFQRAYVTRDPVTRERAIEEVPVIKDLVEPKRQARPVPDDVLTEVLSTVPDHVADAIQATLHFGFRKGEVFRLTIAHVDFQAGGIRLEFGEVKNREDSFMPGSRHAMQLLARLVDQAKERGARHLITWRRSYKDPVRQAAAPWKPLKNPKRAWGTAMDAIEKKFGKRWRWHDVRAAFITQVAISAGPLAAQKLARHADFDTTQGYIAVADEVMRAAAESASARPALNVVKGGKS